jgi:NAD(P)-dependent dehydrogenase (short-subunit alcohol dehydrogenase family)
MRHSEKRVLVAGGTGALGRAVTLSFLEQGATVVVTGRRKDQYDALLAAAGNDRERLSAAFVDVADASAAAKLAEEVVERHGRLDVLVNSVGGYEGGASVWETEPESYRRMVASNLDAGFALARAVLPHMIRQGRGWIVGVASKAAAAPAPGAAAYAAAKAGAVALYSAIAEEVRPYRVNVNTVAPSIFDTAANREAMPQADFARWATPEEIARVVLFLCSEDARVIHGAVIPVYGRG